MGSALRRYSGFVDDETIVGSAEADRGIVYETFTDSVFQFDYPVYKYRWSDGEEVKCKSLPVGLEALMEGSAHAIQRDFLSAWPEGIQREVHNRLYAYAITSETGIDVRPLPYNITDLLVTRSLREKGGFQYKRGTLLALTDFALMRGGIILKSRRAEDKNGTEIFGAISHPGNLFVKRLEMMSRTEIEQNQASLDTPAETISALRDVMARQPDPDALNEVLAYKGNLPVDVLVEALDSVVRHRIVVPLLKMRLEHGDDVFRDTAKYMQHFGEFPTPLAFVQFGGPRTLLRMYDTPYRGLPRIWTMYCLLVDTIAQVVAGHGVVSCTRRTSPLLEGTNLAFEGDCSELIELHHCAYAQTRPRTSLPKCAFSEMIDLLGL
jgi:hypothetical protein